MVRRRTTVGVIGLGFGRGHIPAFQAAGCEVVAVCQRNGETARAVAARYGVPQAYERWEELLERAKPDVAVIATPPSSHLPIFRAAVEGGAHVLCEKPLAMNAAEGREMVELARRAGRVAMTSFNWRFPVAHRAFHQMTTDGHLGRPMHLVGRWMHGRFADPNAPSSWRQDLAEAGFGTMGDSGVHMIDMIRWSFGEFRRVAALSQRAFAERTVPGGARAADAEDTCLVLAELASGAQASLAVSRAARGVPAEHVLEAFGTTGALAYRLVRGVPRWYRGELRATSGDGPLVPVPLSSVPRSVGEGDDLEVTGKATIGPLVKELLRAIRAGEAASPSLEDGLRAQMVLDAIAASAARGAWVEVDGAIGA
jgi:predicted dehydrogenase